MWLHIDCWKKKLLFTVLFNYKVTIISISWSIKSFSSLFLQMFIMQQLFLFRPASFQLLKHCLIQNPVGFTMIFYDNLIL